MERFARRVLTISTIQRDHVQRLFFCCLALFISCTPTGYYYGIVSGSAACKACDEGYSFELDSSTGNGACVLCSAGTYIVYDSTTLLTTCTDCPVDTYSSTSGAWECISCPAQSSTGSETGQGSVNGCICLQGFRKSLEKSGLCELCSDWQYCAGPTARAWSDEIFFEDDTLKQGGYFRPLDQSASYPTTIFDKCIISEACLAGDFCQTNHKGWLCQNCVSGYSRPIFSSDSLCEECKDKAIAGILITLGLIGLYVFSILCALSIRVTSGAIYTYDVTGDVKSLTLFSLKDKIGRFKRFWSSFKDSLPAIGAMYVPRLRVLIHGLILLSAPAFVVFFDLDLPDNSRDIMSIFRLIASLPPVFQEQLQLDCLLIDRSKQDPAPSSELTSLQSDFSSRINGGGTWTTIDPRSNVPLRLALNLSTAVEAFLSFALWGPFIFFASILVIFSIVFYIRVHLWPREKKFVSLPVVAYSRVIANQLLLYANSLIIVFVLVTGPSAVRYLSSIMLCRTLSDGESRVYVDPNISCFSQPHLNLLLNYSIPGLAFWMLLIPLGCIYGLSSWKHLEKSERYRAAFGVFSEGMHLPFWSVFEWFRDMLAICISVTGFIGNGDITQSYKLQLTLLATTTGLSIVGALCFKPWKKIKTFGGIWLTIEQLSVYFCIFIAQILFIIAAYVTAELKSAQSVSETAAQASAGATSAGDTDAEDALSSATSSSWLDSLFTEDMVDNLVLGGTILAIIPMAFIALMMLIDLFPILLLGLRYFLDFFYDAFYMCCATKKKKRKRMKKLNEADEEDEFDENEEDDEEESINNGEEDETEAGKRPWNNFFDSLVVGQDLFNNEGGKIVFERGLFPLPIVYEIALTIGTRCPFPAVALAQIMAAVGADRLRKKGWRQRDRLRKKQAEALNKDNSMQIQQQKDVEAMRLRLSKQQELLEMKFSKKDEDGDEEDEEDDDEEYDEDEDEDADDESEDIEDLPHSELVSMDDVPALEDFSADGLCRLVFAKGFLEVQTPGIPIALSRIGNLVGASDECGVMELEELPSATRLLCIGVAKTLSVPWEHVLTEINRSKAVQRVFKFVKHKTIPLSRSCSDLDFGEIIQSKQRGLKRLMKRVGGYEGMMLLAAKARAGLSNSRIKRATRRQQEKISEFTGYFCDASRFNGGYIASWEKLMGIKKTHIEVEESNGLGGILGEGIGGLVTGMMDTAAVLQRGLLSGRNLDDKHLDDEKLEDKDLNVKNLDDKGLDE